MHLMFFYTKETGKITADCILNRQEVALTRECNDVAETCKLYDGTVCSYVYEYNNIKYFSLIYYIFMFNM
jgi:hypothetical protein